MKDKITNTVKEKKAMVIVAIAILLAIIIGIAYTNTPANRAAKQLELGLKCLVEQDYDRAIAYLENAIRISPNDERVIAAIDENSDILYQIALKYSAEGRVEDEQRVANILLAANPNSYLAKLIQADIIFNQNEYEKSKETYVEAQSLASSHPEADAGVLLCDVIVKLLDHSKSKEWTNVIDILNSNDVSSLFDKIGDDGVAEFKDDITIKIGERSKSKYLVAEDTVVIAGANTCSIYTGGWEGDVPSGNGQLTIWDKNEGQNSASVFNGNIKNGKFDGTIEYTTDTSVGVETLDIDIKDGVVDIYSIDDYGNVIVYEDKPKYVAENVASDGNVISDYIAGVPCFGGDDKKLSVVCKDLVPPVFNVSLSLSKLVQETHGSDTFKYYQGKYYMGKPGMSGITAEDNIDGDITDLITMKELERRVNIWGYKDEYDYEVVMEYSVTDSSGNTAKLIVEYNVENPCWDDYDYQVLAIKNE